MARKQPRTWVSLAERKPITFDLVTFRDADGKEQPGWWDGWGYNFGNRRIGDPVAYMTGPVAYDPVHKPEAVTYYTFNHTGKKGARKSRD